MRTSSAFFYGKSLKTEFKFVNLPSVAGGFPRALRETLSTSFEVSDDPGRGHLPRTSCLASQTYFSCPSPSHNDSTI